MSTPLPFVFPSRALPVVSERQQEFDRSLAAHDIDAVLARMTRHTERTAEALRQYATATHAIMHRRDKIITDKNGAAVRMEPVWKLPVPYPAYINEIALVFLYGRPVKWTQASEDTDNAFRAFQDVLRRTRFDSRIRQAKRLAGAETESALLFRTYRNKQGQADVQICTLARSKGDEIYTRFDQYGNLLTFAWGYYVKEEGDTSVHHVDVYTDSTVYHCADRQGWQVEEEQNIIGKIPVIYLQQATEWHGVERLIHREEFIASRTADTNDYFADPVMILSADIVRNLPEKKEAAKTLITNDAAGVPNAAKYLTWDSAPQSKKDELDWLQDQILSKSFTPRISLDALRSMSSLSAKALQTVMLLANIKAARHREQHDELLDRTASLITTIIARVLDVQLARECENLVVAHEFQNPFGDDTKDDIDNITRCVEAGILSAETAVEQNPVVRDIIREKQRIEEEQAARILRSQDVFH